MKHFFVGALRFEFALGLAVVISAALFTAADWGASSVSAWYWSLDALAQQRVAHLAVVLVPLGVVLACLGCWLRRGRGQAGE